MSTPPRTPRAGPAEGCEPWTLPQVGGTAGRRGADERPLALTAAQLEALQQAAWSEAYAAGRAEGLEKGYAEGRERSEAEIEPLRRRCREMLDLLAAPLDALDAEVEEALVTLALAVARQLVRRALRADPGEVVAALRQGLAVLPSSARQVRVFLHPEDVPVVRDALAVDGACAWRVEEDPLLTRAGCRIESEASRIDATVEGRLAAVVAQVLGGERAEDGAAAPPRA